jgi:hypothetical protein
MPLSGLTGSVSKAAAGVRFLVGASSYLRQPISMEEARGSLEGRVRHRGQRLLDRLQQDVFARPGSVYRRLFKHAGCEYRDAAAAIRQDGVEAALRSLFKSGIYLTVDEFKGRRPIRRGTLELEAGPDSWRSPRAVAHLSAASGGSRSAGTPVLFDLRFVRDCAANCAVFLDVLGGGEWRKGDWETPGAAARFRLLRPLHAKVSRLGTWFLRCVRRRTRLTEQIERDERAAIFRES